MEIRTSVTRLLGGWAKPHPDKKSGKWLCSAIEAELSEFPGTYWVNLYVPIGGGIPAIRAAADRAVDAVRNGIDCVLVEMDEDNGVEKATFFVKKVQEAKSATFDWDEEFPLEEGPIEA